MSKLSLILPTYGGNLLNAQRTIESVRPFVDDVVCVSTAMHIEDVNGIRDMADSVVEMNWNTVFHHGFSHIHNAGLSACKNPWVILLGISETIAEQYQSIEEVTTKAPVNNIFLLDHHGDINRWGRIYCRDGPCRFSGIIHEAVRGGPEIGVIARMADTDKISCDNPLKNEVLRWIKALSYNHLYRELLYHPEKLQGTDPGWNLFVNGAKESIESFCSDHDDMLKHCLSGDLTAFLQAVDKRMDKGEQASGCNFEPQGEPMTEGAI